MTPSFRNLGAIPPVTEPFRVLAIDVGAGTQDILVYDRSRPPENWFKMVLPSQTQIVGRKIRAATERGEAIHLNGTVMGGGASTEAIAAHLSAGFSVSATPTAARTVHNDLAKVAATGIRFTEGAAAGEETITLQDVDLNSLQEMLDRFGVPMPEHVAIAVQDHGYRPGSGNNQVRFAFLQEMLNEGGAFPRLVYTSPPPEMTRMQGLLERLPGVYLMDTGAAAVIGALGDPLVAAHGFADGAILVNVGNMHTFATLIKGERLYGLFEHHTSGITPARIQELVGRLQAGNLDPESFAREYDGHGAAIDPAYREEGPFGFVAITGPNRGRVRELGYYEAAPHGDMMLTGSFGLVAGVMLAQGMDPTEAGLFHAVE